MKKRRLILGISGWLLVLLLSVKVVFSISKLPDQHHPEKVLAQTPVETPVVSAQLEIDPKIPQRLYRCLVSKADQENLELKSEQIMKISLLGQTMDAQQQTYFSLAVHTRKESSLGKLDKYFESLVKIDVNGKCTSLHSEEEYGPLSYYVSMPIAQELALQKWNSKIQRARGKEKLQQELIEDSQHGGLEILLASEDIWAFKKLGISLPPKYTSFHQPLRRSGPIYELRL